MFTPYHNDYINEFIETQEQQDWIDRIAKYDMHQLELLNSDLKTDMQIDPTVGGQPKLFNIKVKAIARAIQRHNHKRKRSNGVTLFGVIGSIMEGMIIGDEWSKRF